MKKVTILLSTYNGEKYIHEQLDSIFSQQEVDVHIVVRDDGSSDATRSILSRYEDRDNITILYETNCGAEKSFDKLCYYALANTYSDYYAFCDQDDVWDNIKLIRAIDILDKFSSKDPNLYFSNLKRVDEALNPIGLFYQTDEVFTNKEKALLQVFTYGCTCVFNRVALNYYCGIENSIYHDNWIYILCAYLGNVYYDNNAYINYRQHCNNLSGQKTSGFSLFAYRIKRLFKGNLGHNFEQMAQQLLQYKKEIVPDDLKLIEHVANYRKSFKSKCYLLFSPKYQTGNRFKDLCIKFRILINHL